MGWGGGVGGLIDSVTIKNKYYNARCFTIVDSTRTKRSNRSSVTHHHSFGN